MYIWQLVLIVGSLAASTLAFIWMAFHTGSGRRRAKNDQDAYSEMAEQDVEHIFSETFREELRNRGRLHFEKIISDNALFLQQDLRLTTSQLNDFLKGEVTQKLQKEFAKYEESINDAKELAIDSITKTQKAIEQQHQDMSKQIAKEFAEEKTRLIKHFEENMTDIVNHYIMAAIGEKIDLDSQLNYVYQNLKDNKEAIIKDIESGA